MNFNFQEVSRREQEIAEKKNALEDMKRKNQLVQDKVQEQIKTLTMKLEELRVEHQTNEASADSIISCLQDKLIQVRPKDIIGPELTELSGSICRPVNISISGLQRSLSRTASKSINQSDNFLLGEFLAFLQAKSNLAVGWMTV